MFDRTFSSSVLSLFGVVHFHFDEYFFSSHCFRFLPFPLYIARTVDHIHLFKHKMMEKYNLRNRTSLSLSLLFILSWLFATSKPSDEDRKRHKHALIYFCSTLFANNCKQDLCCVTHFTFCLCPLVRFRFKDGEARRLVGWVANSDSLHVWMCTNSSMMLWVYIHAVFFAFVYADNNMSS